MPANYSKIIVCLASSRKPGGRCVAGKEVAPAGNGGWVRPVSARSSAEISLEERQYENGQEPEILDVIDIPMIGAVPRVHQQENHMIDSDSYWSKNGSIAWGDLERLADAPTALWSNGFSTNAGNNDRVPVANTPGFHNSLWLIKPSDVTFSVEAPGAFFGNPKRVVRAAFRYQGVWYDLRVTDLAAERTLLAKENGIYPLEQECYLCVSLAEVHTDGYCYKLVATIITERPL
jgi:hypothetical protein